MNIQLTFLLLFISCAAGAQKYFQQEVNYTIEVKLNDLRHELHGNETIEYINNSAIELQEIYMHIWPNAYKNNETALSNQLLETDDSKLYYAKAKQRGFIDQLDFKVNGEKVRLEIDSVNIDICKLLLNLPLKPGEKIIISTPFHVKLPEGIFSRLGHLGQAYQITQWYPKPAVFDKKGWHPMPYLNQGEFYSEFGSFDVSITLPANYVVGATGDLVNGEKELEWLMKKARETDTISKFSSSMNFPESDTTWKTLRYTQKNVHDFAWFADKRFHVLKGEVILNSGKKVDTWVMFTNSEPKLWKKSIQYMNDAVSYYSKWLGEYPYNHVTAIDGALTAGAGMEYPNITVIGPSQNDRMLETVIVHEVGHNWFYGIIASNEREHPWMDEGINSFYEHRYLYTKYANEKGISEYGDFSKKGKAFGLNRLNHKTVAELTYLINASRGADQPVELPAPKFTDLNYAGVIYSKAALIFNYLKAYLGEEVFDRCMRNYYETWKFKHPQPDDIHKIFEEGSGKDLNWFFNDLIQTTKKIDYKICSTGNDHIRLKNIGKIQSPISIAGVKNGEVVNYSWHEGFEGIKEIPLNTKEFDRILIDPRLEIPEINRQNNSIRTRGIFKKMEPVKFQFLASVPNPQKTEIYYFPMIDWNQYDKLMLGSAFYNSIIPQKRFEYYILPMYALGSKSMAGNADIAYNWFPVRSRFQNIRVAGIFAQYSYQDDPYLMKYQKIAPEISFIFRNKNPRNHIQQSALIRSISIFKKPETVFPFRYCWSCEFYSLAEVNYLIQNKRKINPYSAKLNTEFGDKYSKQSIELNYKISYPKKKGIDIRVFTGFFYDNTNPDIPIFHLSGNNGAQDYKFEESFLGRSETEGKLAKQFSMKEGGFKSETYYGISDKWIASINLKVPFPGFFPIGAYGDAGTFQEAGRNNIPSLFYEAGAYISIGDGFFEIYFPLTINKEVEEIYEFQELGFKDRIRFVVNLGFINPIQIVKNMSY